MEFDVLQVLRYTAITTFVVGFSAMLTFIVHQVRNLTDRLERLEESRPLSTE